ncbi:MAG: SpoIIE family protein phosphatase [Kiritimatiellae bacterium]|nr:SpoIIE family protein phosphatase [Kiritimatiellia bacterium]
MSRRLLIFGGVAALYTVLMTVTWIVSTRQAEENTQTQLDYAVLNLHDTVAGAIDTMLGHIARTAVRHIGSAQVMSLERMAAGAKELDIDEVSTVSREGIVIASNDPRSIGVDMTASPVLNEFMELTNGVTATVSQPFRAHARNPNFRAKYLAAAFPGGDGYVQVGLEESRLKKMLPSILGYIFDEWLLGEKGFFLCADMDTGRLISNPSRHRGEARTLAEAGYDTEGARRYEVIADGKNMGRTFVQTLFGEKCFCRAFLFGGHRFVAALPEREYYGGRNMLAVVFGVTFLVVLGAFAILLDRIFRDSDRLKRFYAAEDDRRAKDMEIAKTIQNSALPTAAPESPCFRIDAAMHAARDVGGDFYDYFVLDATHIAFLVADVSGKGVTAALYMMTAKTLIKNTLLAVRDPAAALTEANAELCANNPAMMFLTAWVGVLDLETGVVTFANAGHNPPVAIAGPKSATFVRKTSGPVLAFIDGVKYAARTMRLPPGGTLFLYTDGVTEATDAKNGLFGEERLLDALNAVTDPDPHAICGVVRTVVAAFSEGMPQADDITVMAVRYLKPPKLYSRKFPPRQEGVANASEFLDETIGREELRDKQLSPLLPSLHVILDEMCSNIVRYSNAAGFEVDIEIVETPLGVRLTFIDDGDAYDPLAHADPDTTLPAAERPIGGLGIFMVKRMASSIAYRRSHGRNILSVVLSA